MHGNVSARPLLRRRQQTARGVSCRCALLIPTAVRPHSRLTHCLSSSFTGVFGNNTGLKDATCSTDCWTGGCNPTAQLCEAGYYCPQGSISGTQVQCGDAGECARSPGHVFRASDGLTIYPFLQACSAPVAPRRPPRSPLGTTRSGAAAAPSTTPRTVATARTRTTPRPTTRASARASARSERGHCHDVI